MIPTTLFPALNKALSANTLTCDEAMLRSSQKHIFVHLDKSSTLRLSSSIATHLSWSIDELAMHLSTLIDLQDKPNQNVNMLLQETETYVSALLKAWENKAFTDNVLNNVHFMEKVNSQVESVYVTKLYNSNLDVVNTSCGNDKNHNVSGLCLEIFAKLEQHDIHLGTVVLVNRVAVEVAAGIRHALNFKPAFFPNNNLFNMEVSNENSIPVWNNEKREINFLAVNTFVSDKAFVNTCMKMALGNDIAYKRQNAIKSLFQNYANTDPLALMAHLLRVPANDECHYVSIRDNYCGCQYKPNNVVQMLDDGQTNHIELSLQNNKVAKLHKQLKQLVERGLATVSAKIHETDKNDVFSVDMVLQINTPKLLGKFLNKAEIKALVNNPNWREEWDAFKLPCSVQIKQQIDKDKISYRITSMYGALKSLHIDNKQSLHNNIVDMFYKAPIFVKFAQFMADVLFEQALQNMTNTKDTMTLNDALHAYREMCQTTPLGKMLVTAFLRQDKIPYFVNPNVVLNVNNQNHSIENLPSKLQEQINQLPLIQSPKKQINLNATRNKLVLNINTGLNTNVAQKQYQSVQQALTSWLLFVS